MARPKNAAGYVEQLANQQVREPRLVALGRPMTPSLDQAMSWYDSEDYRRLKSLRLEHAQSNLAFVEGLARVGMELQGIP